MGNLLEEIKRRNVVRVVLAYLAACWLVAQAITVLGDLIVLPAWIGPALLVVLAAGFVVVVVVAWMYELTGQGLKTEAELRADPSLVRIPARYFDYLIIALLTIALGYFIWESRFDSGSAPPDRTLSVAVLPFADLSPDGGQQWFAIGMADDLMSALVRIPELRVAGRRSAASFDPKRQDLAEFAESIGVSHVLEGSVRVIEDRVRVSAQLVRAADGFNVWSQVFDERSEDVFAIQRRISQGVLTGLRLHLGASDRLTSSVPEREADFAAYQAYLQGKYHLSRRTAGDLEKAIRYFNEALRLEPGDSRTHSALASVYALMPYYARVRTWSDLGAMARFHATSAIRLDEENAEAHSILGLVHMTFGRDWAQARSSFARAFELSAGDADVLNLYGDYFYLVGDYVSAEEMESTAAALEPLSAVHQLELGLVYDFSGQHERAVRQARLAISLNPDLPNAWWQLCRSYIHAGTPDLTEHEVHENAAKLGPRYVARVRALLASQENDRATLLEIAAEEERQFLAEGGSPTIVAYLFALAGDDASAAAYVRRAIDANDAILVSPMYFFLPEDWRGLERLREALDREGLAELYELRRRHIAAGVGRAREAAVLVSSGEAG